MHDGPGGHCQCSGTAAATPAPGRGRPAADSDGEAIVAGAAGTAGWHRQYTREFHVAVGLLRA